MARILIIDDDNEVRTAFRMALEQAGHEVEEAGDGVRGVEMFRAHPTELIIVDIVMPEKTGLETMAELQREFPFVKFIAVSGGGPSNPYSYLEQAKRSGAQHVFAKPLSLHELVRAVRDTLTPASSVDA